MNTSLHKKPIGFLLFSAGLLLASTGIYCTKSSAPTPDPVQEVAKEDSLSFLVVGDWGKDGIDAQLSVANQMNTSAKKHNIQFIVSTGDNFYPHGVTSTTDTHWTTSFENVYTKEGHQVTWYPLLGNHDYEASPQAEIDYSALSNRWKMPARYHVVKKPIGGSHSVQLTFTDTNPFVTDYYSLKMADLKKQDTAAQLAWLKQSLATSTDTWKIVLGHHPLYSAGAHGNTPELIERFKPVMVQNNTDFYISGHDHSLQYKKISGEPVNYIVSGAGAEKTRIDPNDFAFAQSSLGFVIMTLYPTKAVFYYYNQNGDVLYKKQIDK